MNLHDRDIRRVALAEGREQGAEQKAIETAKKLISMGLSLAQVAEGTGLPLEKVQQLQAESSNLFLSMN
jgi:predicted transposase/invertase (TIGR01784 family)